MPDIDIFRVFVGWDSREDEAFQVARSSLLKHATCPISVMTLKERALRHSGLYRRTWNTQGNQKIDDTDGKPFATEFSFTRFLVPALCQWDGWALFVDCDWLFMTDISKLFAELDDSKAVMVCKQEYNPTEKIKMDGQRQERYFRKNWSSFIAFNCSHPTNYMLTVNAVNEEPGSWLHGFGWVPDDEIGDLDPRWNWIEGTTEGEPLAVHYTLGGPWFEDFQHVAHANEWRAEAQRIGVWNQHAA